MMLQVRLCLDRKDFIRAQILSRKINPRSFTETPKQKKKAKEGDSMVEEPAPDVPTLSELRRIYYELMIRFVFELDFYVIHSLLDIVQLCHNVEWIVNCTLVSSMNAMFCRH